MIKLTVPIYWQKAKGETVLVGMNAYRNWHYMTANSCKKFYAKAVNKQRTGKDRLKGKLHVHYDIYLKRRGSDGGNVRSVIEKFVLDGAKKSGMIVDDNADIIVSDSSKYYFDKTNPRAEITISKIK